MRMPLSINPGTSDGVKANVGIWSETPIVQSQTRKAVGAWKAEAEVILRSHRTPPFAEHTIRSYMSSLGKFASWCVLRGIAPLPTKAEVWAEYLAECLGSHMTSAKVATLRQYQAGIFRINSLLGTPVNGNCPEVMAVWDVIRSRAQASQSKAPILSEHLVKMLSCLPRNVIGLRNRAILLLGFATALPRSVLVGLDLKPSSDPRSTGWLEVLPDALIVRIVLQSGQATFPVAMLNVPQSDHPDECPVAAVRAWTRRAQLSKGPLFRPIHQGGRVRERRLTDRTVARIVKDAVKEAGYDPLCFSSHSLRSGSAISQALENSGIFRTSQQLGHRSLGATLRYFLIADKLRQGDAGGGPAAPGRGR